MEKIQNLNSIPSEKFRFAAKTDFGRDKKLETKPIGYFQDAFRRFCKNKGAVVGAIVIAVLILFSIFAPLFTPYTPAYSEDKFARIYPKNNLFVNTNFWDGCKMKKNVGYLNYFEDYVLGLETGKPVIKDGKVTENEDGTYTYRYDTYYGVGFGQYEPITKDEYLDIQRYQIESGRQVLYPVVKLSDRKKITSNPLKQRQAKYYYKTVEKGDNIYPLLDKDGNIQVNYWSYSVDAAKLPNSAAEYNSTRIEGETGATNADGQQVFYVYATVQQGGTVEVRLDRYEYYRYRHTQVLKDGIEDPYFLFGTTDGGKDIFSCLAYGARFSFLFALIVAAVNMFVGAIWGSIAGYFGGKLDLFMERFTDILGAVPTMIVITLMKYHFGASLSQALVLFIAYFATGWIGMAGSTRMQFYRFKNQEYVLAARTLGASDRRIMFKHIFPNAIGTLVTRSALIIPGMIYSETSLTYLGIINLEYGGTTSVGVMIAAGQRTFMTEPYAAVFPCGFLVLLMLSFNLFGNGLRDAFNPSLRGSED